VGPPSNESPATARRPGSLDSRPAANESRVTPSRPVTLGSAKPARRATSWLPIAAAAVLVVAVLVGGYFLLTPRAETSNTAEGVLQTNEGQKHVPEGTPIQYVNNPPSSGDHFPSPKPWGVYEQTIAPGYWVHNLEHGGIVVLYDCPQGCPEVVKVVQDGLKNFPKDKYGEVKLVSTPYSGLPNGAKTAVVAWQWVQTYPGSVTYDQLLAFFNAHVNRSPEDVP
jgi:hypothetical protein